MRSMAVSYTHLDVYKRQDADRVLPVDVLRDMEKEGVIGELHHLFYTTV